MVPDMRQHDASRNMVYVMVYSLCWRVFRVIFPGGCRLDYKRVCAWFKRRTYLIVNFQSDKKVEN